MSTEQIDLLELDEASLAMQPDDTLDDIPQEAWAKDLVQLIEVQELAFTKAGIDPAQAFRLARVGVLAQAEYHGGRQFYLPRGDRLHIALRDAEIYRRANRRNIRALAQEYGLIDSQIWRICRQQHKLHLRKVQGQLFEGN